VVLANKLKEKADGIFAKATEMKPELADEIAGRQADLNELRLASCRLWRQENPRKT